MSMNKNRIEKGDLVDITFDADDVTRGATILKHPNTGNDPWIARVGKGNKQSTLVKGQIFYFQQYRHMTLAKKAGQ